MRVTAIYVLYPLTTFPATKKSPKHQRKVQKLPNQPQNHQKYHKHTNFILLNINTKIKSMKAQKNEHISILDYNNKIKEMREGGNWDRGSLGLVRVMVLVTIGTSCVAMVCWVTMARHNILNNFYYYN